MYEKYSDEWFVERYFKHGSVEEALQTEEYLPISSATFHRKLNSYGIVSSAGRHTSLSECLRFFSQKAENKDLPLKKIYKNMPYSFQTSLVTLHRVLNSVEKKIIRREAAVLLISHPEDKHKVIVGNELIGNKDYKKKIGQVSVPTSFSKKDESNYDSVLRVLQNEFSNSLAIKKSLTNYFDLENLTPFMQIELLDVGVNVFHLVCPFELINLDECNSYKLSEIRFININDAEKLPNIRTGAEEIITGYKSYLKGVKFENKISRLNLNLTNKVSNLQLA